MPIYADVIVDINSAALDRVFTYELPETGEYSLGTRVKAPFGGRTIEGYIIALKSEPGMDASKVKRVLRPLEDYAALTGEQIELAMYMRAHCKCTLSSALRLMIPAQMRGERIKVKTCRMARLLLTGPELDTVIESQARAPKRRELLETLRDMGGCARTSELPKGSSGALKKAQRGGRDRDCRGRGAPRACRVRQRPRA